ncbi:CoA transferase [Saccharopolyspora sp. ID03-671]|uniref:CaiB/BaiF CoA transferase family protein n=1 Tax=Saccharopolyspora sp. ID03-671 TaxID=3073066 RepID=UPI003252B938
MTTSGPLADALVLDLSRALAGPHAAMMLGDLGARVIKVESPGHGDDSRTWGPPFVGDESTDATYYLSANRNKESLQLDLKSTSGHEALRELIRRADVLIENFRPGVFDRLGFPPAVLEELNPRLVVLSISGFGHDGPESERPGYDLIAQGESGLMSITGPDPDHPTRVGVPIGDLLAGIYGAFGVVSALHDRNQTGRGTVVRTSLLAALVGAHAFHGTAWTTAGKVGAASGNHHPQIAPYGAFRCADGTVQVAVGSEAQWRKFADLLGLDADDERFATNSVRTANRAALIDAVEDVLRTRPRDFWLTSCNEAGIPAGAVRTIDEVYEWEQTRSQGLVVEVEHPVVGKIEIPGPPLRFETFAGQRLGRTEHTAPPTLGQHTSAVSQWLDSE